MEPVAAGDRRAGLRNGRQPRGVRGAGTPATDQPRPPRRAQAPGTPAPGIPRRRIRTPHRGTGVVGTATPVAARKRDEIVEFFASGGRFWLPEHPHRVVHGELAFDDDGIGLQLMDPLRASAALAPGIVGGSPQVATEAVVHGLFHDGREVTLLHASGYSMPVEQMQETWSASFALTGGLIAEDRFSQVWVVLDYLMPWAQPPGIVHAEPAAATFTIDPHRSTLGENTLADGRVIRLITGVEGRRDEASVHFEQWCAFEVEGEPTSLIEILNEWVRPLQDLLVICLGRPVRLDTILLRPPDQDARMPLLRLSFNAVQPPGGRSPSAAHLESYAAPTLLTYSRSPLPFADLISEWFSL